MKIFAVTITEDSIPYVELFATEKSALAFVERRIPVMTGVWHLIPSRIALHNFINANPSLELNVEIHVKELNP